MLNKTNKQVRDSWVYSLWLSQRYLPLTRFSSQAMISCNSDWILVPMVISCYTPCPSASIFSSVWEKPASSSFCVLYYISNIGAKHMFIFLLIHMLCIITEELIDQGAHTAIFIIVLDAMFNITNPEIFINLWEFWRLLFHFLVNTCRNCTFVSQKTNTCICY